MKLQIISINKGFLTIEIMLAFSLIVIFVISTFTFSTSIQELKIWSIAELDKIKNSIYLFDKIINNNFIDLSSTTVSLLGNDIKIIKNDLFEISHSDYYRSWGRENCNINSKFENDKAVYFSDLINIDAGNLSTDIEVRNNIVYLTADSNISSQKDFYIIDINDITHPNILSSLNTGPGLSGIEVAGPYAFIAQSSTVNQLQIIDIHDRHSPVLISQIKLPLPTPTTTAPFATSIFYSKGYIYLGTTKWNGLEFNIIDVSNIYDPIVIGQFETDTLINDIYVYGDKAYLATADSMQMRILNISNKNHPILIDSFSPSGWQTQEGKALDIFENNLAFGRTVGGFNVTNNHEFFLSASNTNISKDIPGGIYGILLRKLNIYLLTHSTTHEFQVFDSTMQNKIFDLNLKSSPVKMKCDGNNIFFVTGDSSGFSFIKLYE